jgi:hypothetical protein
MVNPPEADQHLITHHPLALEQTRQFPALPRDDDAEKAEKSEKSEKSEPPSKITQKKSAYKKPATPLKLVADKLQTRLLWQHSHSIGWTGASRLCRSSGHFMQRVCVFQSRAGRRIPGST